MTAFPIQQHGIKLMRSFENESWLKAAADRVPEATLLSDQGYEAILTQIITHLKPFLDLEPEVIMEEFLYNVTRGSSETLQSYIARKTNKHTEMMQQFAQVTNCGPTS